MAVARIHAERVQDPLYVDAVKLFIGKEQRHAKDLKRFMEQEAIPLARKDWTDSWFRRLRKCANLEVALSVLLVAELIATVYYDALRQATRSLLLATLCTQILHDEHQHVRFQCQTLGQLRAAYAPWLRLIISLAFKLLFTLTVVLVWFDHRSTFRAGHYSLPDYWRTIHQSYHWAKSLMAAASTPDSTL